ncbi:zinc finger protein 420 [Elysia marginata]|uniref:Zinc finger protein 420 n=1 Tax=Elysia marginata TaxID=1093978 RepID=A0AAV4F7W6_9GAST|nr:zinc finger protein 420 [Elysia marginata]
MIWSGEFLLSVDPALTSILGAGSASFTSPNDTSDASLRLQRLCGRKKGFYACEECFKVFNMKQSLVRHKWKCEGTRILKCNVCSQQFHRMDKLRAHQISKHGGIGAFTTLQNGPNVS